MLTLPIWSQAESLSLPKTSTKGTLPFFTRYAHPIYIPAFVRGGVCARQIACTSVQVGICHAGQPNRNQVATTAGIAIEARGKMQRCFVRGLNRAKQDLILNGLSSLSSAIYKRTWRASLTPNDIYIYLYIYRTASLTSRRCILYI
jgi:hypothetical protein